MRLALPPHYVYFDTLNGMFRALEYAIAHGLKFIEARAVETFLLW